MGNMLIKGLVLKKEKESAKVESYNGNLYRVVIPSIFQKRNVTIIGIRAFKWCVNTNIIKIPNTVTIIDQEAFMNCFSLKEIIIPKDVTYIGRRAFANCMSLEKVTFLGDKCTLAENAFLNCKKLKYVNINNIKNYKENSFENCDLLNKIMM